MDDGGPPLGKFEFTPLVIGLIGVAAGAVIVAMYQCLVNHCCCSRRLIQNSTQEEDQNEQQGLQSNQNIQRPRGPITTTTRSNNFPVHLLPAYKYSKNCTDGICAVCLSEFTEGAAIRVLPECMHLFHVLCIDTWLHSHSNCPLCRTSILPLQRHVVISMPNLSSGTLRT